MKAAKNSKEFNGNVMPTTKKKVFKKKGNSITPAKTNAPISKSSSEGLKLIIGCISKPLFSVMDGIDRF